MHFRITLYVSKYIAFFTMTLEYVPQLCVTLMLAVVVSVFLVHVHCTCSIKTNAKQMYKLGMVHEIQFLWNLQ